MKLKQFILVISFFIFSIVSYAHGDVEADYHFTENKGQLIQKVKYHCKLSIGDIYFEKNKFMFDIYSGEDIEKAYMYRHYQELRKRYGDKPISLRKHAYSMEFLGANMNTLIKAVGKKDYYKNYILGNNPDNWSSKVSSFSKISYQDIYPHINIGVYEEDNFLKYDFIVSKGGDPDDIIIAYNNVEQLTLNNGILEIQLSVGVVKELKPISYQFINGEKILIDCYFEINNKEVSFKFPNGYDTNYELVIDPTWVFSTFSGSTADNWAFTATYDGNGNFYGGGIAFGVGYPTSSGAYNVTFGGNIDIVVTKFNPQGTGIIYSTYIGGSDADQPHSLVTDSDSNLVVFGVTSSMDFPVLSGAYDSTFNGGTNLTKDGINYNNGTDIFVLKLDNYGAALIGSTYLGGSFNDGFSLDANLTFNYADHARGEVVLDANNDICIASSTFSIDFPTTSGSHSQTPFGGYDGVVCKLSGDLTSLSWSTYIGGASGDAAYSIRIDKVNNKIFVCGGTTSNNIGATAGVVDAIYSGATDGFIAKFDNTNGLLDALTYVGTVAYDQSYIIEVDRNQDIYVVGQTKGSYPVTPSTYNNAGSAQFIHKMNNNLTATYFSTVFGDSSTVSINISLTAFMVDNCDNIYVSGWGGPVFNNEGSTNNMPITANAIQLSTDGNDFYFMVLDKNAQNLLYGTYFGSPTAQEHVDGGTSHFDRRGNIYQGVCAGCGGNDFPTSPGAYSNTNGTLISVDAKCNYGAIKIDFGFSGVVANPTIPPIQEIYCDPPYNFNFSTGNSPSPYSFWDFGDLTITTDTSSLINPMYTYLDTGTYQVMYVAIDSLSCNIADTIYFNVTIILKDTLAGQFTIDPYDPCTDSLTIELNFLGISSDSLYWDMGNGVTFVDSTFVQYTYTIFGNYEITLEVYDLSCNDTLILTDSILFTPNLATVNAPPPQPVLSCSSPYTVSFVGNTPQSPGSYWDFGDGIGTSTAANPTYTYADTGTYVVTYVVEDFSTCNITDTAFFTFELDLAPPFSVILGFDTPPPCGTDTFLVELSYIGLGQDSLFWDLGDGTQFEDSISVTYIYNSAGDYVITMTAFNFLCNPGGVSIESEVKFIEYEGTESIIPNVFTPNGDGINDFLQIVGVDETAEYNIEIFNRWGVNVFQGKDALSHWDGGSNAEGTYFYILKYTDLCSGEEKMAKGTVTLLK